MLVFLSPCRSDDSLDKGWHLFNQCIQGKVVPNNFEKTINSAIHFFNTKLEGEENNIEASIGLMRSILLKGDHALLDIAQRKKLFHFGKRVGKSMHKKAPDNGAVIYWYIACLGRWAQTHGIMKAIKEGVADKVKTLAEKLIKIDSPLMKSRGHRILGRLHFKAPYIPFVLSWPSNKRSIKHLEKAYILDPSNPVTLQYLAEVYYKEGNREKALQTIRLAIIMKIRPKAKIIDEVRIQKCRSLEKLWSQK